ncbi:MAG: glycerol-3-phosphate responsive antiterminator [Eubacteriaceae bacterium]
MIKKEDFKKFKEYPVIAAVRTREDYFCAINSKVKVIFMVGGDVFKVKKEIDLVKQDKRLLFFHMDLVEGIGKDHSGIHYAVENFGIDGIISTKNQMIKIGKQENITTVHRIFLMDFLALNSGMNLVGISKPDFVELTPGVIPKVVRKVKNELGQPIIASGLISSEEDVKTMIRSGANNIVCSCKDLWSL